MGAEWCETLTDTNTDTDTDTEPEPEPESESESGSENKKKKAGQHSRALQARGNADQYRLRSKTEVHTNPSLSSHASTSLIADK